MNIYITLGIYNVRYVSFNAYMQACIDAICMNITHNRCVVTTNGSVDRYAMSLRPSQRLASGRALLAVPLGALHHWKKVGCSAFAVF